MAEVNSSSGDKNQATSTVVGAEMPPLLDLEVHPLQAADAVAVGLDVIELIDSINAQDRQLGGKGLRNASVSREAGVLMIRLTSIEPTGSAERVSKLVERLTNGRRFTALVKVAARLVPG